MLPLESWRNGFDERFPIYRQIIDGFSRSLARGELAPGDRIPSIRELALMIKVNSNTIQRAYQEMERGGLIFSQRGTGYFVMHDEHMVERVRGEMVKLSTTRFLEEMRALGFDGRSILSELEKQLDDEGDHNAASGN